MGGGAGKRHGDQREQGRSLGHERQQRSQIKPLTAQKGREVYGGGGGGLEKPQSHASEKGHQPN